MPAEWHPHQATWLTWPKDPKTWPDRVELVRAIYEEMMGLLSAHEGVELLVDDAQTEADVRARLAARRIETASIRYHRIRTADSWIRDYGPNFLLRSRGGVVECAYNDWGFNAWGEKYAELMADDSVPARLQSILGLPRFLPGLILEGGSIDVNGAGVCLTSEQCLLNRNRNPALSRSDIEERLRDFLGVHSVLWLGDGIEGDDTDGHVDDIARFVDVQTIVCALEEDPQDPNFKPLQDNLERLRKARTPEGEPYRVVTLPMPSPREAPEGRLPASYANFYIANRQVLVPVFGDPQDAQALQTLRGVFPNRQVVGLPCEPMIWGMGAIHCLTQQQPLATG